MWSEVGEIVGAIFPRRGVTVNSGGNAGNGEWPAKMPLAINSLLPLVTMVIRRQIEVDQTLTKIQNNHADLLQGILPVTATHNLCDNLCLITRHYNRLLCSVLKRFRGVAI